MKINIWVKEDDIEIANTLIESKGIGPFLKKKYKGFAQRADDRRR